VLRFPARAQAAGSERHHLVLVLGCFGVLTPHVRFRAF